MLPSLLWKQTQVPNCEVGGDGGANPGNKFSCSIQTHNQDVIVVFFGCEATNCGNLSVADSPGNTYTAIISATVQCYLATCKEEAFWARTAVAGTDTLDFIADGNYVSGADIYAVSGISTLGIHGSNGTSSFTTTSSTSSGVVHTRHGETASLQQA